MARGNAIIAELFRLSDYIPAAFRAGAANKYTEVLFNFSYLSNQAYYENAIMAKAELQALDDELKFNHLDILNRFYLAFESIHKYASDLCRFLEDLDEGIYIQQNVDSILLNADGKQLLVEALYLYGLMLLIVDIKFEGSVREHMLVGWLLLLLAMLPSFKLTVPVFKGSSTTLNATNIPMVNVTLTNAVCLVIGCITLFKQFHTDFRNQFIAILGQYVRSCKMLSGTHRPSELPADANKVIEFVEEFFDLRHLY